MSLSATMDLLAVARDAGLLGCTADAEMLRSEVDVDFSTNLTTRHTRLDAIGRKLRRLAHQVARFGGRDAMGFDTLTIDHGVRIIADPNCPLNRAYLLSAKRGPDGVIRAHGDRPQVLMHPTTLAEYERRRAARRTNNLGDSRR